MGAVDLVIQIEAPPSVAAGLQRVGRAGHQVGAVSRGVVFPKHRGDLLSCAVVAERMHAGLSRSCGTRVTRSMCWPSRSSRWWRWTTGTSATSPCWCAGPRRSPSCPRPRSRPPWTCSPGATRPPPSPSCGPRIVWDRATDLLTARPGAQRLAVTSGGTIPDRGLFGVFLAGARAARPGSVSSTRRWSTSPGSATCSCSAPPPGGSRRSPPTGFWSRPRPARRPGCRSGRATSRAGRWSWAARSGPSCARWSSTAGEARRSTSPTAGWTPGPWTTFCPMWTSSGTRPGTCPTTVRWWSSASATSWATGGWPSTVCSARRSTAPGRWPSGAGSANGTASTRRCCPATTASWSGCPTWSTPTARRAARRRPGRLRPGGDRPAGRGVRRHLGACSPPGSASAPPGPCCCPGAIPRRRQPLWQQRQRAAQLLDVAREFADFPITLEAARECLQDVLDVPGLVGLMRDIAARKVRLVEAETTDAVAVRPVAAVRIRRRLPVRRRRAAGRTPGRRAGAGLHPAGRAAWAGSNCANCSTRGGDRDRARGCSGSTAAAPCATPRTWSSCCGCSATCPTRSA